MSNEEKQSGSEVLIVGPVTLCKKIKLESEHGNMELESSLGGSGFDISCQLSPYLQKEGYDIKLLTVLDSQKDKDTKGYLSVFCQMNGIKLGICHNTPNEGQRRSSAVEIDLHAYTFGMSTFSNYVNHFRNTSVYQTIKNIIKKSVKLKSIILSTSLSANDIYMISDLAKEKGINIFIYVDKTVPENIQQEVTGIDFSSVCSDGYLLPQEVYQSLINTSYDEDDEDGIVSDIRTQDEEPDKIISRLFNDCLIIAEQHQGLKIILSVDTETTNIVNYSTEYDWYSLIAKMCGLSAVDSQKISNILEKGEDETLKPLEYTLGDLYDQAYYKDEMTGLYNQQYIHEIDSQYSQLIDGCTVIFVDLDNLKLFNDSIGYIEGGDNAIKAVAESLKKSFRDTDIAIRYHGDEFLVIIPDRMKKEYCVERESIINDNITQFANAGNLKVSVSLGYTTCDGWPTEDDISRASEIMKVRKKEKKKKQKKN